MKSLVSLVYQVLLPNSKVETAVINSSDIPAKIGVISQQEADLLHPKLQIILLLQSGQIALQETLDFSLRFK